MPATMTYDELRHKAKQNFDQAKAILSNPDSSAEDKLKVEPLMEDAKSWNAQALQLKELEKLMEEQKNEILSGRSGGAAGGDTQDGSQFKDWGEFLQAIWQWGAQAKQDKRLVYFKDEPSGKKDLSEQTGASGGFLVQPDFYQQVMALSAESAIVRSRATRIRMTRRQVNIPVLEQTATTAGVPHWFGGMQAYYAEEASEKTQSDPAWREIELVARKLIMYTRASDELVDDAAISLTDFLSGPMGMAGCIAWTEDYYYFNGTGAGTPLGVINAPATITVNRVDQDNVVYDDLVTMIENALPSGNFVWVISQSCMSNLLLMNGPTGNPSYIWGNATNGAPNTLLGYPVIWSEKVPRISTTSVGDVGLYDFKYYLIGDRQATTVESTKFDRWRFDQTSWRAVFRHDGQPWLSAPLTYQDGTTQVSPFVILGAKST